VMRVPERELLTAMCRTECVVDVEFLLARLRCRVGLIDQSCSRAASVLLGAFSRRLMVDCEASGAPIRHLGFARATVKQRCVGCRYMPLLGEATHPSFKVQLATPVPTRHPKGC